MKRLIILVFLSALFFGCSKDEENYQETDIHLVTGMYMRQYQESTPTRLGNPNTFTENLFITYPNPAINSVWVASSDNISNAWIIPANKSKNFSKTNFTKTLNSDLYSKEEIEKISIKKFEDLNWPQIGLNIENLDSGYYKIFIEINGEIFWDNIYVSKNPSEAEINNLIKYWN